MVALTAGHIGQTGGSFEPQRSNAFTFEVDVPYAGGKELIRLSLASAFMPKYEGETFQVEYMNEQVKFFGRPVVAQEGTIKLKDYVDQNSRDALLSWYKLCYNWENGAVGLAYQYKRDAHIITFAPEGSYTRLWKLQGCFIKSIEFGELTYGEAKPTEISVVVSYDKPIPLKGNGSAIDVAGVQIGTAGGVSIDGISL